MKKSLEINTDFSTRQVCEYLDVSVSTLTQYKKALGITGHVKIVNCRHTYFFTLEEMNRFKAYADKKSLNSICNDSSWRDFSGEQKEFSVLDLQELLSVDRYNLDKARKALNLKGRKVRTGKKGSHCVYTYEEYLQLKNCITAMRRTLENKKRLIAIADEANRRQQQQTIEELKKKHPLVRDVRCFDLNWWPDVVPDCYKVSNDTTTD